MPALLGAELEPYPYLSGYGLLLRISHLSLPTSSELSAMGLRNRVTLDVLAALRHPGAPVSKVLAALGLQGTPLGDYWSEEVWSPIRTNGAFAHHDSPVRQCADCAKHGYHCTIFQLPSIQHCPWHGTELSSRCSQCSRVQWSRFDSKNRLGRCACGHDPLQLRTASVDMWTFPTAAAEAWLQSYLAWATGERAKRWLVVPAQGIDWGTGFATLARPPQHLQVSGTQGEVNVEVFDADGPDPPDREFWGWSLLGGERPLTYLPLPSAMYEHLCQATRSVIDRLPDKAATPLHLVTLNGFDPSATLGQNIQCRPDCFIAPHGLARDRPTWLNVSSVDPCAAWFCGQPLDTTMASVGVEPKAGVRSLQTARSDALDQVVGRKHLASALQNVLTRAYAQGLGVVIQSLVGGRDLAPSGWFAPAAEIAVESGEIASIRICWFEIRAPKLSRASATPPPRSLCQLSLPKKGAKRVQPSRRNPQRPQKRRRIAPKAGGE